MPLFVFGFVFFKVRNANVLEWIDLNLAPVPAVYKSKMYPYNWFKKLYLETFLSY